MTFQKGNKLSFGLENSGAKPAYATKELLEEAIHGYFESSWNKSKSRQKPTISGMAYHLGFISRQSMYDYEKKGAEFSYTIKRARLFIEQCFESQLFEYSWAGASFWLKNHDWKDETTQNQIQTVNKVEIEEKKRE